MNVGRTESEAVWIDLTHTPVLSAVWRSPPGGGGPLWRRLHQQAVSQPSRWAVPTLVLLLLFLCIPPSTTSAPDGRSQSGVRRTQTQPAVGRCYSGEASSNLHSSSSASVGRYPGTGLTGPEDGLWSLGLGLGLSPPVRVYSRYRSDFRNRG